jgi:hypothetical protein
LAWRLKQALRFDKRISRADVLEPPNKLARGIARLSSNCPRT